MCKITLTVGISGSGKTTWAEEYCRNGKAINLNRDDVRFALFTGNNRDWREYKFTKKKENDVTRFIDGVAENAALLKKDIIVSDTNLNPKTREKWKQFAEMFGYEYEERVFHITWEEAVARNAYRQNGVTESNLWNQYVRYMRQYGFYGCHPVKEYEYDDNKPDCVIVDIDGTVAQMVDRKPYDWNKVGSDMPRFFIINLVEKVKQDIIFVSGRDGVCYNETFNWLSDHIYGTPKLYMRKPNDSRKDDVVKYEIYKEINKDYNVVAVFDDRPRVIRMWNVIGIPNIINVGNYGVEF